MSTAISSSARGSGCCGGKPSNLVCWCSTSRAIWCAFHQNFSPRLESVFCSSGKCCSPGFLQPARCLCSGYQAFSCGLNHCMHPIGLSSGRELVSEARQLLLSAPQSDSEWTHLGFVVAARYWNLELRVGLGWCSSDCFWGMMAYLKFQVIFALPAQCEHLSKRQNLRITGRDSGSRPAGFFDSRCWTYSDYTIFAGFSPFRWIAAGTEVRFSLRFGGRIGVSP